MTQSFFVYIIFGLLLFLLGCLSHIREKNNRLKNLKTPFWTWDVWLALFVFAFVSGVRWNVGVDHQHYLANYLSIQNSGYSQFDKEIGFEFITSIFANSNIHFSFYFGFLAFLQIFFIYNAFKDQRYLYPFLGIIILFGPEYLSWMNGIRQMLAATLFVFSVHFIVKRQFVKYLSIIFIASLMHTSALVLIVFYFIPQKDYFKNRLFTIAVVILSILLGSMTFWIDNLKSLSVLFEFIGNDFYAENMDLLLEEKQIRVFGPRRIVIILIALSTIWISSKLKKRFKDDLFLINYNFAIFGFLLYNLFGNTHHIFIRPITYLTIFSIPTTAYLLFYLKERGAKRRMLFFIILIISLSYLPISILADNGKGIKNYTSYKFYWYNI